MMKKDKRTSNVELQYVEDPKVKEQKNKGWYWHWPTKKFYRWSNLPRENT